MPLDKSEFAKEPDSLFPPRKRVFWSWGRTGIGSFIMLLGAIVVAGIAVYGTQILLKKIGF